MCNEAMSKRKEGLHASVRDTIILSPERVVGHVRQGLVAASARHGCVLDGDQSSTQMNRCE